MRSFRKVLWIIIIAFCSSSQSSIHHPIQLACDQGVRAMFLLDGSDSIRPSRFEMVKTYVLKEIKQILYSFSDAASQVSVMVFSANARFTDFVHPSNFYWQDSLLVQPRRTTNTGGALRASRELLSRYTNENLAKVIIIISDGHSIDPRDTITQAQLARENGITILTLGVGDDLNVQELATIASTDMFYKLGPLVNLQHFSLSWQRGNCKTTTPATKECPAIADIMWIVDLSDSIQRKNIPLLKSYIVEQSLDMGLGSPYSAFGLVTYSDDVVSRYIPNVYSRDQYIAAVMSIQQIHGGTNTAAALNLAGQLFASSNRGTQQIAIVLTDGQSLDTQQTRYEADVLKSRGVRIAVINAGPIDNTAVDELRAIASMNLLFNVQMANLNTLRVGRHLSLQRMCASPTTTTRIRWTPRTWTWRPRSTSVTTEPPPQTFPTLPPVQESTLRPIEELCSGCALQGGMGYNSHPSACDKFIICTLDWNFSRFVSYVVNDCPFGLFWDQTRLVCDRPSEVRCAYDQCQTDGVRAYRDQHPSVCQVYWECSGGRTVSGKCCAIGLSFDNAQVRCLPDPTCVTPKCGQTANVAECVNLRAHPTTRTMYQQYVAGDWQPRQCAPGTAFPEGGCSCNETVVMTSPPTKTQPQECRGPELYLPFDKDFRSVTDSAIKEVYVGVHGVQIRPDNQARGGSAAYFNGSSYLRIPRFNNFEWPSYFRIEFRYKPENIRFTQSAQALITNGACLIQPTLSVSHHFENNIQFLARTNAEQNNILTTTTRLFSEEWHTVRLEVNTEAQLVTTQVDNGEMSVRQLTGRVMATKSDLFIGHGEGFGNFTGMMDEIYVYLCNPQILAEN